MVPSSLQSIARTHRVTGKIGKNCAPKLHWNFEDNTATTNCPTYGDNPAHPSLSTHLPVWLSHVALPVAPVGFAVWFHIPLPPSRSA